MHVGREITFAVDAECRGQGNTDQRRPGLGLGPRFAQYVDVVRTVRVYASMP